MYIHERDKWTDFRWDMSQVSLLQEKVFRKQGLLYGRLSSLGFDSKLRAMAENLTYDVVYSSEIEGIRLNVDQVRSSIARKLGIENVKYTAPSHYVDSVVGVMLEAVQHYDMPLSKEKLCAWQAAFFPSGYSDGSKLASTVQTRSILSAECLGARKSTILLLLQTVLKRRWKSFSSGLMTRSL